MAIETPVPVDTLPPAPDDTVDIGDDFNTVANAYTAAIPPWGLSVDAIGLNVYNNALEAEGFATTASSQAVAAANSASSASGFATDAENSATASAASAQDALDYIATIPGGTLNDAITSPTNTWSSDKITQEIAASGGGTNELDTYINTDASGLVDLDFAQYSAFEITATGNLTLNAINLPAGLIRSSAFLNAVNFDNYTVTEGDRFNLDSVSFASGIDVSAQYNTSFSVLAEDANPRQIAFNSDGTKMFVAGTSTDSVYEYTLSIGFDLGSTVNYSGNSFSVSSQDTFPTSIAFNSDGTKMFVSGDITASVYEYTLSIGFDLGSTVNYSGNSFSVSSQDTNPRGITFNADGTKLLVSTSGLAASVYEYTLSIGFDLGSTVNYSGNSFDYTAQFAGGARGVTLSTDSMLFFITGASSVFQYNFKSPLLFDGSLTRIYINQFSEEIYGSNL